MPDYYYGEIRAFAFDRIPDGWAACRGQLVPTQTNQALSGLLGERFGARTTTHFRLPDLGGRVVLGAGPGHASGSVGGTERYLLSVAEMPEHRHQIDAATTPTTLIGAANNVPGDISATGGFAYRVPASARDANLELDSSMAPEALTPAGGGMAHENRQPYLALQWCIAVAGGIFPSRGESETSGEATDACTGDLRIFAFDFMPDGWVECKGQEVSMREYAALASVIGTEFGPATSTTFRLPDLRGRTPVHRGEGPGLTPRLLGQAAGEETVALEPHHLGRHTHEVQASNTALAPVNQNSKKPAGLLWGHTPPASRGYAAASSARSPMHGLMVDQAGGGKPHGNMQPYTALTYGICAGGSYPDYD